MNAGEKPSHLQHSSCCAITVPDSLGNPKNFLNHEVHTYAGPHQGSSLTLRLTSAAYTGSRKLQVVPKKVFFVGVGVCQFSRIRHHLMKAVHILGY